MPALPDAPGIYLILNCTTGRRWVGAASRSMRARELQHRRSFSSGVALGRLQEDLDRHGPAVFVFLVLEQCSPSGGANTGRLRDRERWWAEHLHALDQHQGYNLEAGGLRSPASLFRDHERKLMRGSPPKYVLLPDVHLDSTVNDNLLGSWHAARQHQRMDRRPPP